jgi:hypothetical protein
MATTIKFKRNSSSGWATANTVLGAGEPGFERNTGNLKIGNGVTPWNELPYVSETLPVVVTTSNAIGDTVTVAFEGARGSQPTDTSPNF